MADAEATATAQTTANFGESEFGDRLDYGKSQYQDLWAFIAFYVHVVAILVIGIILGAGGGDSDATPSPTFAPNSISYGTGTGTGTGTVVIDFDFSGIFVTLVCGLVAGAIFAILWLKLLQLFAESIIKILLFVQIGCWVAVAVIGLAYDAIYLTVIGIIFALIFSLYTWCVWSRIPFAGACLAVASTVTMLYHGVVWYALIMVFFNFIWNCIWMTTAGGYFTQTASEDQSNVVIFLLLVSFYWGVNVWRNVSHTTTCGVAATCYFNAGALINPSRASFKRAMTTSFGSICFGSLLVTLLQPLRGMLRNSGCKGCLVCILAYIERLMRYFNAYAFAQVAIYMASPASLSLNQVLISLHLNYPQMILPLHQVNCHPYYQQTIQLLNQVSRHLYHQVIHHHKIPQYIQSIPHYIQRGNQRRHPIESQRLIIV
eukprot:517034_1